MEDVRLEDSSHRSHPLPPLLEDRGYSGDVEDELASEGKIDKRRFHPTAVKMGFTTDQPGYTGHEEVVWPEDTVE